MAKWFSAKEAMAQRCQIKERKRNSQRPHHTRFHPGAPVAHMHPCQTDRARKNSGNSAAKMDLPALGLSACEMTNLLRCIGTLGDGLNAIIIHSGPHQAAV